MTRVIEDVNSVERVLIDGIEQGVVALLQVIIVMVVMFYLNAKLALLALGAVSTADRRRAHLHFDRASPLSFATPRRFSHERAVAR